MEVENGTEEYLPTDKVRINVRISRQAYDILLDWAGSGRELGVTVEYLIMERVERHDNEARLNATAHLLAAKSFLDTMFAPIQKDE